MENTNITHLESLEPFIDYLSTIAPGSLVVFDVADVLLCSDSALFHPKNKAKKEAVRQLLKTHDGQARYEYLWSKVLENEWKQLVDFRFPRILQDLKQRGIKAMALSALRTGAFGCIKNMEDWRIACLTFVGIDFSAGAPWPDELRLNSLDEGGFYPIYKKGVLFTHVQSKGHALIAFLQKINWRPASVVFVDDKMRYLESVQQELARYHIPFTGFNYVAARNRYHMFDEQLFDFQIQHLIAHDEWLSDEQAKKLMFERSRLHCVTTESSGSSLG